MVTSMSYTTTAYARKKETGYRKMAQNQLARNPTNLVPKSSDKLSAQKYLIRFKIGQLLATKDTTPGSRCPGIACFVKIDHPVNRRMSQNQFSHIPTKFVPKLSGNLFACLLYTSPSPRDQRGSRMPSSA